VRKLSSHITTFLLTVLLFSYHHSAFCQQDKDKIILLSGKVLDHIQVTTSTDIQVKYVDYNSKKKQERFIDKYRIFSVQYGDGTEELIYEYDTLMENDFTIEEMRYFIKGEQDAMRYYHPRANTIAAGILAVAGGYVFANSILLVPVPFVSTVVASLPRVKIKPEKTSDPRLLAQPTYIRGYERVAKSHKIQNALKGSLVGLLVGAGSYYLLIN